ncbi:MAG: tetratricopeptide repeat protein [Blastocatellia bacterium]
MKRSRSAARFNLTLPAYALLALMLGSVFSINDTAAAPPQRTRPRTAPSKSQPKAQPKLEAPNLSPQDALDSARAMTDQAMKITLLERMLAGNPAEPYNQQAREMLMREYALKGEQMLREGNPKAALQAFKSAVRAAPAVINDKIFGQYIFPLPLAMSAFGYRTESVELMRSIEPRFENDANRTVEIGFFYVQIEAPLEALRVLTHAVQLAPQDHRAHNSLGTAYLINLRLDDAANEFQRALELDANDEYANLNLGNLARAGGAYERALEFYRRQLRIRPDDAEARGGMALAMFALGRDEEAQSEIKQTQALAGDYRFLTQLAYFYTTRKKAPAARALIEQALKIEPRYGWALIAKGNIDQLEGKYGDALATLIQAQAQASFPTLTFELVKALMSLDGYDQALEVMSKSFTVNDAGEFEAMLGGAVAARSPRFDSLLERERQAALFINDQPTTQLQYRLAETLGVMDYYIKQATVAKKSAPSTGPRRRPRTGQAKPADSSDIQSESDTPSRPRRARDTSASEPTAFELTAGADANLPGVVALMRAITQFTTLDDGRQPFRMVWVSRRLTDNNLALDAAEQLARRAIAMAAAATEPAGSMRDAPLLDREGRRAVFLGRAYDALGWAQLKKGNAAAAVESLLKSVESYLPSGERKAAMWHLAVAMQEAGDNRRALDYYIASFDPEAPTAGVRRAQIETLYKRVNGSLAGLEEKLRHP